MAYTPTTWNTGDTITATAMNKIENGIANAGGGGYDAEITVYHSANSSDPFVATIVSGTYDNLSALVQNNIPPNILVRFWDDGVQTRTNTTTLPIYIINNVNVKYIALKVFAVNSNGDTYMPGVLTWYETDTINFA